VADRVGANSWLPKDLGVIHTSSAILEILAWWLRQSKPIAAESLAEIIYRLVIAPLGR
jgi:hypothetical protein